MRFDSCSGRPLGSDRRTRCRTGLAHVRRRWNRPVEMSTYTGSKASGAADSGTTSPASAPAIRPSIRLLTADDDRTDRVVCVIVSTVSTDTTLGGLPWQAGPAGIGAGGVRALDEDVTRCSGFIGDCPPGRSG